MGDDYGIENGTKKGEKREKGNENLSHPKYKNNRKPKEQTVELWSKARQVPEGKVKCKKGLLWERGGRKID